jgi:hypothetical protein
MNSVFVHLGGAGAKIHARRRRLTPAQILYEFPRSPPNAIKKIFDEENSSA